VKRYLIISVCFVIVLAAVICISCARKQGPPTEPAATNTPIINTTTITPTSTTSPIVSPTPTFTVSATSTPYVISTLFDFSTSTQVSSWKPSDYICCEDSIQGLTWNDTSTDADGGTGCLQVSAIFDAATNTFDGKGDIFYPAPNLDMTGKTITFKVNIPPGLIQSPSYILTVWIKSTTNYVFDNNNNTWFNLTTTGWQTFSWNLANTTTFNGDPTKVVQIGCEISKGSGSPDITTPQTILFDDISW